MGKGNMVKNVIAILIVLSAAGGWLYLDYLNKQEQAAAAEMRRIVEQNRAIALAAAKARAEARAQFEAVLTNDLTTCKSNAEKASSDYVTQHQKPVPRKPGQFTIPPAVAEEAAKLLEAANADCQKTHDDRIKSGV